MERGLKNVSFFWAQRHIMVPTKYYEYNYWQTSKTVRQTTEQHSMNTQEQHSDTVRTRHKELDADTEDGRVTGEWLVYAWDVGLD